VVVSETKVAAEKQCCDSVDIRR